MGGRPCSSGSWRPQRSLGALGLLFAHKAVHAAMSMALVMVALGVFYIAQDAEFVGIIQIFVYSGAVMMLFLFVVMLVGVDSSDSLVETLPGQRLGAYAFGLVFALVTMASIASVSFPDAIGLEAVQEEGSVTALAREIFERQVLRLRGARCAAGDRRDGRHGAGAPRAAHSGA